MTQAFNLSQFANKVNTSGQASLTTAVTGTLPVANGGTGDTTYTNGQLLIGNTTGNTLTKATLTAGTGISITNGTGSISIASTAVGGFSNLAVITSTNPAYSIPATKIKVTVVAGGGGGSSGTNPGTGFSGGGAGGGGGSGIKVISGLTIGATVVATIGAGGTQPSGTGGTSSFGPYVSCTGGSGGNSTIGTGGTATGADLSVTGGYGYVANSGSAFNIGGNTLLGTMASSNPGITSTINYGSGGGRAVGGAGVILVEY